MSASFPQLARSVTSRPRLTLVALFALVALLGGSTFLTVDQAGNEAFLPDDSDVAEIVKFSRWSRRRRSRPRTESRPIRFDRIQLRASS